MNASPPGVCHGLLALLVLMAPAVPQVSDDRGKVGSTAPSLLLESLDGATTAFPPQPGEDVPLSVLVFWSTWSEPSATELERLTELWEIWQGHGVAITAVNVESSRIRAEERGAIESWLGDHPLPFPVAVDDGLVGFHAYGVIAVPTTIVVDGSGTIAHRLAGYSVAGAERFIKTIEALVIEDSLAARSIPSPDTPEHRRAVRHVRLARRLIGKDEFELAEYTLQQAVAEDAGLLEARLTLAELYERLERFDEAQGVLDEAAQAFPDDLHVMLALADLERRGGGLAAAETLARSALALDPGSAETLLLLARISVAGENIEGALALLTQAAENNPLDPESRVELGHLHELIGQPDVAWDWYEQAYQLLDPSWNP